MPYIRGDKSHNSTEESYENLKKLLEEGKLLEREEDVKDLKKQGNYHQLLYSAAKGCLKNKNTDVFVALYSSVALEMAMARDGYLGSKLSKEELIEKIEETGLGYNYDNKSLEEIAELYRTRIIELDTRIMRPLTIAAIEKQNDGFDPSISRIINDGLKDGNSLRTHWNRDVRLYYCANCNKPSNFLADSDERIRKVAEIRTSFDEKWELLSQEEKENITLLAKAIEKGKIEITDGLTGQMKEDVILVNISSNLFEEVSTGFIPCDEDIVKNIGDKRIMAYHLNSMAKNGEIHLKEDVLNNEKNEILADEKNNNEFNINGNPLDNATTEDLQRGIAIMKNRLEIAKEKIVEENKRREELLSQKSTLQNYISLYQQTLSIEQSAAELLEGNNILQEEVNELAEEAATYTGKSK